MSYEDEMLWQQQHPKGIQPRPPNFSTGSGFWPSIAWLERDWWPYVDLCRSRGLEPLLDQEEFYKLGLGSLGYLNIAEHLRPIQALPQVSPQPVQLSLFIPD